MESDALVAQNLTRSFRRKTRGAGLGQALAGLFRPRYEVKTAVNAVSFRVRKGSCLGLIGANGAGKTTLMKMAAGLLHPTSGSIEVLGHTPTERKREFQSRIGMVMGQKSQLWVDIPAMETYELLKRIYRIPEAQFRSRIEHLSELFQVKNLLGVQVRRLSLGERMKLEIIAALLHGPDLVFLDEPTIGLDVVSRRAIRSFLKTFNQEQGTTLIVTSHDMTDISELCQDLIVIADGRILFDGSLRHFETKYGIRGAEEESLPPPPTASQNLESIIHQLLTDIPHHEV